MYWKEKIWIGKSENGQTVIHPNMANRHGMIAGATGTGKTITLKVLAESFSDCGVPVFLADVKGDLAGMCKSGIENENVTARIEELHLHEQNFKFHEFPTIFWDIYGEKGLPLRTTISEMGPLLLSKVLDLSDIQEDVLNVVFKIADDHDLLLIDTKDLRAMLQYVGENTKEFSLEYGNLSKQSLSAIIRSVVALEAEGGELFFGEPALNIADWLSTDCNGKGNIQILDCQKLIHHPDMYTAFMLWLMSELFETLPEAGDLKKPKMVFFFDEAHLLFDHASKKLLQKIEQVVKLIRSKGVGIYFITQNPRDIPDGISSQLGNKIQHALHAYTPAEQKAVKAAADAFRPNPAFHTYDTLLELGIGEVLISVLDENGVPTIVEKCKILPPQSQMGALDDENRDVHIRQSLLYSRYKSAIDRDSAYEFLQRKAFADGQRAEEVKQMKLQEKETASLEKARLKEEEKQRKEYEKQMAAQQKKVKSSVNKVASSAAGTIGRELGNQIGKQLGGNFGKKLGGNVGASLGRGLLSTLFKL